MAAEQKSATPDVLQVALDNPNVPKIYVNGFQVASTNADIMIVAQSNARPTAVLNMSFELAKTLVQKVGNVVELVEKQTDTKFLTTEDFK